MTIRHISEDWISWQHHMEEYDAGLDEWQEEPEEDEEHATEEGYEYEE